MKKANSTRLLSLNLSLALIIFCCQSNAQTNYSVVQLKAVNQTESLNYIQEENYIEFMLVGMKGEQDAALAENLFVQQPGVARSRANYDSKFCAVITYKGSGINEEVVSDLLATLGFSYQNYTVRPIKIPVNQQFNGVNSINVSSQCDENNNSVDKTKINSELTAEEKLKYMQALRESAIKSGTPTYKYDKAIEELNKHINGKK